MRKVIADCSVLRMWRDDDERMAAMMERLKPGSSGSVILLRRIKK